ncbi:hypothetical protein BST81_22365 [Leptolyngbya sp. 'hensonii']|uniref:WG repeat-containing protein n=1 Tax=Leptolyngbya sp. 'hensonii' TaxID=1922337 RepID=UPI00094FC7A0|nr:WG repeat-containing protein [Leptolyngbya sp. 'hensonii']OLP16150.1 hypothetical protein BST81_22365 [Leptolyngbya sp. 'hensonii']
MNQTPKRFALFCLLGFCLAGLLAIVISEPKISRSQPQPAATIALPATSPTSSAGPVAGQTLAVPDPAKVTRPSPAANPLYPIKLNGKFGYINVAGQVVIPPQFEEARFFSEGMAAVRGNDPTVKPAATSRYRQAQWGFINLQGQWITGAEFDQVKPFSEGLAAVQINSTGSSLWGFVNKTGQMVIPPAYTEVESFQEGLAAVEIDRQWGYIDSSGSMKIQPQFAPTAGRNEPPHSFSEGLAAVMPAQSNGRSSGYGYINFAGEFVIQPSYRLALPFSNGLAAVMVRDKFGFIDPTGAMVIQPQFQMAQQFSENLAQIAFDQNPDDRRCPYLQGYIDKTGRTTIAPQFCLTRPFSAGLALTDRGFINKSGQVVLKPDGVVEGESSFGRGLVQIAVDRKVGYVDRTGRYIWQPTE